MTVVKAACKGAYLNQNLSKVSKLIALIMQNGKFHNDMEHIIVFKSMIP